MVVALQETPTQTGFGKVIVNYGSLHEKKGEEGLAHLLEHCLMKGGSKKYSPEEADKTFSKFGYSNAGTSLNETIFEADMFPEDLEYFLNLTSDILFSPRLDYERTMQEKYRVLREIADCKSNPVFNDFKLFKSAFYGENSPHNYNILGLEEVIRIVDIADLRNFHNRGYNANNMSLILVGALPKNIEKLIEESFGDKPSGENTKYIFSRNQKLEGRKFFHTYAPDLYNHERPLDSSLDFDLRFTAPITSDEDSSSADVLSFIIGGDANSKLYREISQRKGLAYHIESDYNGRNNNGCINICGRTSSQKSEETINIVFDEMNKLKTELVSNEELSRLKKLLRYSIAKAFETNEGHVYAIKTKWDENITPEIVLMQYDSISPEQIREAAIKYLPSSMENGNYVLLLRDSLKKE